jgi:hypothetical protein
MQAQQLHVTSSSSLSVKLTLAVVSPAASLHNF